MRLAAGRSTFAIITPVAARIGSSHFKLLGRTTLRGTAFSPRPNCEASVRVSRAYPRTLHPVFVTASCGYATGLKLTSIRSASNVFGSGERLTETVGADTPSCPEYIAHWSTLRFLMDWPRFIHGSHNEFPLRPSPNKSTPAIKDPAPPGSWGQQNRG